MLKIRRINRRMRIDIWSDVLEAKHNELIREYIIENFDLRYDEIIDGDIHYIVRADKKDRKKLVKFMRFFDKSWFDLTVIDNFVELNRIGKS